MYSPLLQTKLFVPLARPDLVPRPHLLNKLNGGLSGKLTLISAPAGYGKTTLLSDWIDQSDIPFCWLALEENDNDVVRFLTYFTAALQTIEAGIGEQIVSLLHSPQKVPYETILIPLLNQVAQTGNHFALVLDDYHLIEGKDIQDALAFWLEHQPPTMHLVIASRSDPPLPLAKMRARREMMEVREADLRFSLDEVDKLLNQVQNLNLSARDLQALTDRTEGWVVGLQMASFALMSNEDRSGYIQGFAGSFEYIADYLRDEVMSQQSDRVREFLLKTSILDRLTGRLCDAVTNQTNSQHTLKQLKSSNLFLTSLDDESLWYQYHHLFADLLRQQLLESDADSVPSLYLRASHWFENNGYHPEAIEYALRGKHFERAIALIEQEAEQTLKRSEITTFLQWINRLPDELVRGSVSLSIFYSWTLLLSGEHPQDARSYLDEITPENKHVNSQLNAVKSMLAMYQRKYPAAATLARQAMEDLPESDLFFRNIAAWNLSASLYMSGDKKGGEEVLEEVTRVSLESGNRLVAVISLCRLGLSRMQEGELFKPRELFQQALDLAIDSRGEPLPVASEAMIGLGTVHWQWNDLDTASHYLLEGSELSKRWREQSAINGYVALAHLSQSQEEVDLSDKMLEKARQIAARSTATELDDHYVASQQAHLWIRRGDLHAAGRWAAELGLDEYLNKGELPTTKNIGADLLRRYELIVYVRLLTAENRASEALVLLDLLLPFMEQMGILGKIIEIHILQTIGLQSQGKIDEAVTASATALTLAGPEEHLRPFLDEGPSLVVTLKRIAAQGVEADFAQRILKLLSDSKPGSVAQVKTTELAEPLSDRELEILFLLETDLTVPEMAEKLYIAVSTVRSHIKSIYGKLGVHSRFEAVSRAEDFGLL